MTTAAADTPSALRVPLSLQPFGGESAAPAAWLIPGGDASLWLAELCAWRVPLNDLRLLVLPASAGNLRPSGVLVIAPSQATNFRPATSPLAQAYALIAGRLFIPTDSKIRPPMSGAELDRWLSWEVQVLHPTVGLVGSRQDDLLYVADLLAPPDPLAVDWSRAEPGVVVEPRIHSVKPVDIPAIELFMHESGDGIGGAAPTELPPLPQESALNQAASKTIAGGMGAIAQAAGAVAAASGFSWAKHIAQWAAAHRDALRKGLDEARHREIARLMRLLESEPDEGLKFALPLNSFDSTRGLAPPGSMLGRRNIDFRSSSGFSSGRSDPWALQAEVRQKLITKYRELASRELALGRFRRAAYIFAELLGDLTSAANALQQGRFYREAAALYRERLKNPLAAATCLEKGGLLEEAIEIYETLKLYEKVGDLYRRLGQEEQATEAYRAAINELMHRRDTLAAAKLLDTKLAALDEALELLWSDWPAGSQAGACAAEALTLLGRSARHDEAARRVTDLARHPTAAHYARMLADLLATTATTYPAEPVRLIARDATRVVAGRRLAAIVDAPLPLEARGLLNAVTRATVDDRLLLRDTTRYLDALDAAVRARPSTRPREPHRQPGKPAAITMLRAFEVSASATSWQSAIARGPALYFAGLRQAERTVLARANWDGKVQFAADQYRATTDSPPRLEHWQGRLAVIPRHEHKANLRNGATRFPVTGIFQDPLPIVFTAQSQEMVYDACTDELDRLWTVHASPDKDHLVLSTYGPHDLLEWSSATALPVPDPIAASGVLLAARDGNACVTYGPNLFLFSQRHGNASPLPLGGNAVSIAVSPPHTRLRVAVAFEEGASLIWPLDRRDESFAAGMIDPVVCLTNDGLLVAAGRKRCAAYRIEGQTPQLIAEAEVREQPPIAVVPGAAESTFAIVYEDGHVQIMKCG